MPGTFFGIETATRALRMNQTVLDVIGHNVSNVDTPDYTRQTAEITATDPYLTNSLGLPQVSYGTGVEVSSVDRIRDEFLERRLDDSLAGQARYQKLSDTLTRVQSAYNEPGDGGLNNAMTTFFNSFEDVSQNPESTGPRAVVLHNASDLSQRFRDTYSALSGAAQDNAQSIQAAVQHANDLAREVAQLNVEVQKAVSVGGQSNDLADRRDAVVRELSTLTGATAVEVQDGSGKKTGMVSLSVGGLPLVADGTAVPLPTTLTTVNGQRVLQGSGQAVPVTSGTLGGLIQADSNIRSYMDDLNTLASKFITTVNAQHQAGYGLDGQTGRALFSGTDASNIGVDPSVAGNPDAVAAASAAPTGSNPASGNGDNARAIANIATLQVFGSQTIQDYYNRAVTQVGADASGYADKATNQTQVVQQLTNMRNSVSGVNMDEELSRMLQFQRGYQAAAKLVSTYDTLLNDLITAIGSVA